MEINSIIREVLSIRGVELRIFGQLTTSDILENLVNEPIIDTVDILEGLKDFEMDTTIYTAYTEEELKDMPITELLEIIGLDENIYSLNDINEAIENEYFDKEMNIEDYIEMLDDNGELEEISSDNTYNWNAPLTNHLDWKMYHNLLADTYIVEIKAHLYGDVRGNYTDVVYLEFENEHDFMETMYEVGTKQIEITIDDNDYSLSFDMFREAGYFDIYNEDIIDDCEAWLDSDDIENSLKEYLLEGEFIEE